MKFSENFVYHHDFTSVSPRISKPDIEYTEQMFLTNVFTMQIYTLKAKAFEIFLKVPSRANWRLPLVVDVDVNLIANCVYVPEMNKQTRKKSIELETI